MKNFLFIITFSFVTFHAQNITVYNNTTRDLYVALYVFNDTTAIANLVSNIYYIEAGQSQNLQKLDASTKSADTLLFAEDKTIFIDQVTTQIFNYYNAYTLGYFESIYLGDDEGTITGYDPLEWYIYEKPLQAIYNKLVNLVPSLNNNPYKNIQAKVRLSNELCAQEISYENNRVSVIKNCLKAHGKSSNTIPKIALVCSGGGCRAALYTAGALYALEQMKLLDSLSWISSLSGSTWTVNTWMSSGTSVQNFYNWLINNMQFDVSHLRLQDFTLMEEIIASKYLTGQPIGFVDLYGSWLANDFLTYFSGNPGSVALSGQAQLVSTGTVPLPIYSAINATNEDFQLWYEFTPFEIGASWMGAYIPTWSFGRKFKAGISRSNCPEQNLGNLMGTFGLAIGVTLKELFADEGIMNALKYPLLKTVVQRILDVYGNDRMITAEYGNFSYAMPQIPLTDEPIMQMVDAGISFNLPYPPISGQRAQRKADIIIFIDASAGHVGAELQNVQAFAQANNLPFPFIDYTNIAAHAVSVFKDDTNKNVPTIIYVPRIVDQALLTAHYYDLPDLYNELIYFDVETCIASQSCNTFNFSYTPQQASVMASLGRFNTLMIYNALMDAIDHYNQMLYA